VRTKGATLGRLEGTYAEGKRVVGTAERKLREKKRGEEREIDFVAVFSNFRTRGDSGFVSPLCDCCAFAARIFKTIAYSVDAFASRTIRIRFEKIRDKKISEKMIEEQWAPISRVLYPEMRTDLENSKTRLKDEQKSFNLFSRFLRFCTRRVRTENISSP